MKVKSDTYLVVDGMSLMHHREAHRPRDKMTTTNKIIYGKIVEHLGILECCYHDEQNMKYVLPSNNNVRQ
jgi:hypothetical protein